jgi:hypothetical protein
LGICGLSLLKQGIQDLFEDEHEEQKTQFESSN